MLEVLNENIVFIQCITIFIVFFYNIEMIYILIINNEIFNFLINVLFTTFYEFISPPHVLPYDGIDCWPLPKIATASIVWNAEVV